MNNSILLSICIPTYNRAEYLNQTIQSIVNSDGFGDKVEIVISDNCSTDNTEIVCKQWNLKHTNIKYFKQSQPTDVADRNFISVLSLGTGQYLKLNNDIVGFKQGTLKFMLDTINKHLENKSPIFFHSFIHNQVPKLIEKILKKDKPVNFFELTNLDSFINTVSTATTWISNFGCWKEHFDKIQEKDRFINAQFMQVDWSLKIFNMYNHAYIYVKTFYNPFRIKKEGTVDAFGIHGKKYLSIYDQYLKNMLITKKTFQTEKRKVLTKVLIPMLALSLTSKNHFFQTNNLLSYLKDYKYNLYLYYSIFVLLPICILFLILRNILNSTFN